MKIFLDFDDVLFNTRKFKKNLWGIFLSYGFSRREVDAAAKKLSSECFKEKGRVYDPFSHIKSLRKTKKINERKLKKEIDAFLGNLHGFVFSDCHNFLESFSKSDLYLISYGEGNFQNKKIKGSGLFPYFKKIIVTGGNKEEEIMRMAKKDKFPKEENIIFIDDRLENLEMAEKGTGRIMGIHLRRPQGRYSEISRLKRNREAKNLKEALKIIKKKEKAMGKS